MNRIYKTIWNAARGCLVVVNEAVKTLGGQSSGGRAKQGSQHLATPVKHLHLKNSLQTKKSVLALIIGSLFFGFSHPSSALQLVVNDGDYTGNILSNYDRIIFNQRVDNIHLQGVESPNGFMFIYCTEKAQIGGVNPYDYPMGIYAFAPTYNINGDLHLSGGGLNAPGVINGDIIIEGHVTDGQMANWITPSSEANKVAGSIFFGASYDLGGAVVNGDIKASVVESSSHQPHKIDDSYYQNGRAVSGLTVKGNLETDYLIIDSSNPNSEYYDNFTSYLEVHGTTHVKKNAYLSGQEVMNTLIVDGTLYNAFGTYLYKPNLSVNNGDPEAIHGLQPPDFVSLKVETLDAKNIVNASNLFVGTLTNDREQTYNQTYGTIRVTNNWFRDSVINMSGGYIDEASLGPDKNLGINNVFNITGGTLIVGDLNFDSTVNLSKDGKIQTDIESIFINPDGNPEALNYVSLNASEPESVKASLTKWFTNYVAGTLRTDLEDHVNFDGGSIVVSGFGKITETQYRDLLEAFKDAFGDRTDIEFDGEIAGVSTDDIFNVPTLKELQANVVELKDAVFVDRVLLAEGEEVIVGEGELDSVGVQAIDSAVIVQVSDGKTLALIGSENNDVLAGPTVNVRGQGSKLMLGTKGYEKGASLKGTLNSANLSNGADLQVANGSYTVNSITSTLDAAQAGTGGVTIDQGASLTNTTLTMSGTDFVNAGQFTGSNVTMSGGNLSNTGTVTLKGGLSALGDTVVSNEQQSSMVIEGDSSIEGTFTNRGQATMGNLDMNGTFSNAEGATIEMNKLTVIGSLNNYGTLLAKDDSSLDGELVNYGTITLHDGDVFADAVLNNTNQLVGHGQITVNGLLANVSNADFSSMGTSVVVSGEGAQIANGDGGVFKAESLVLRGGATFVNGAQGTYGVFTMGKAKAPTRALTENLDVENGNIYENNGESYFGQGTIAGTFNNQAGATVVAGISDTYPSGSGLSVTDTGVVNLAAGSTFTMSGALTNAGQISGEGALVLARADSVANIFNNSGTIDVGSLAAENITFNQNGGSVQADSGWFENSVVNVSSGDMSHDTMGLNNAYTVGEAGNTAAGATLSFDTVTSDSTVNIVDGGTLNAEKINLTRDQKTVHLLGGTLATSLDQIFGDVQHSALDIDAADPDDLVDLVGVKIATAVGDVLDSIKAGIEFGWGTVSFSDEAYSVSLVNDVTEKLDAVDEDYPDHNVDELQVVFTGKSAERINLDVANQIVAHDPEGNLTYATLASEELYNETSANTGFDKLYVGKSDTASGLYDASSMNNLITSIGFKGIKGTAGGVTVADGKHLVLVGELGSVAGSENYELIDGGVLTIAGKDETTGAVSQVTLGSYGTTETTKGKLADVYVAVDPNTQTALTDGVLRVRHGLFTAEDIYNAGQIVIGGDGTALPSDSAASLTLNNLHLYADSEVVNHAILTAQSIVSADGAQNAQLSNTAKGQLSATTINLSGTLDNAGTITATTVALASRAGEAASVNAGTLTTDSLVVEETAELKNTGTLAAVNDMTVKGSTVNDKSLTTKALTVEGQLANNEKGSVDADSLSLTSGSVTNAGTMTLAQTEAASTIAAALDNQGTFTVKPGANALEVAETGTVENSGTFDSDSALNIAGSVTNSGTLDADALVSVNGGQFTTKAGADTQLTGLTVTAGQVKVEADSTFTDAGKTTVNVATADTVAIDNAANLKLTDLEVTQGTVKGGSVESTTANVAQNGILTDLAATFGELINAGKAYLTTGTISQLTNAEGAILEASGALKVAGSNAGTVNVKDTGSFEVADGDQFQNTSDLTVDGTATVNGTLTTGQNGVTQLTGGSTIAGTLETLEGGSTTLGGTTNVTGTVTVAENATTNMAGETSIAGSVTNAGALEVADGSVTGTLESTGTLDIGSLELSEGGSLTASGTTIADSLIAANGSVTANGDFGATSVELDKDATFTVEGGTAQIDTLNAQNGAVIEATGGATTVGDLNASGVVYNQMDGTLTAVKGWFKDSVLNIMGGRLDASSLKDDEGNALNSLGHNTINISGQVDMPAINDADRPEDKENWAAGMTIVTADTLTSETQVNIDAGGVLDVGAIDLTEGGKTLVLTGGALQTDLDQIFSSVTTEGIKIDATDPETGNVEFTTEVIASTDVGAVKDSIKDHMDVVAGDIVFDDDYFSFSTVISAGEQLADAFDMSDTFIHFTGSMAEKFTVDTASDLVTEGTEAVLAGIVLDTTTLHNTTEAAGEANKTLVVGGTQDGANSIGVSMGFKNVANADSVVVTGDKEFVLVGGTGGEYHDDANKLLTDAADGGSVTVTDGTFTMGSWGMTAPTKGWVASVETSKDGAFVTKNGEFGADSLTNAGTTTITNGSILHSTTVSNTGTVTVDGVADFGDLDNTGTVNVAASGALNLSNTDLLAGTVNNAGQVTQTGAMEIAGDFNVTGSGKGTFGDVTLTGDFTAQNGTENTFNTITVSEGATVQNAGTMTVAGAATINGSYQGASTSKGSFGDTTVTGTFDAQAGSVNSFGSLTISDNGKFTNAGELTASGDLVVDSVLDNTGKVTVAGNATVTGTYTGGEKTQSTFADLSVSGQFTAGKDSVTNVNHLAVNETGAFENNGTLTVSGAEGDAEGTLGINVAANASMTNTGVIDNSKLDASILGAWVNSGEVTFANVTYGNTAENTGKETALSATINADASYNNKKTVEWDAVEVAGALDNAEGALVTVNDTFTVAEGGSVANKGSFDAKYADSTVAGSFTNDSYAHFDDLTIALGGQVINNAHEDGQNLSIAGNWANNSESAWKSITVAEGGVTSFGHDAKTTTDKVAVAGGSLIVNAGVFETKDADFASGVFVVGNNDTVNQANEVTFKTQGPVKLNTQSFVIGNGNLAFGADPDFADSIGAPSLPKHPSRVTVGATVTVGNEGSLSVGTDKWTSADKHFEASAGSLAFGKDSTVFINAGSLGLNAPAFDATANTATVTIEKGSQLVLGNINEAGKYVITEGFDTSANLVNGVWNGVWTGDDLYALPQSTSGLGWSLTLGHDEDTIWVDAKFETVKSLYPDVVIPWNVDDNLNNPDDLGPDGDWIHSVLFDGNHNPDEKTEVINSVAEIGFASSAMATAVNGATLATNSVEDRLSMSGDAFNAQGLIAREPELANSLWVDVLANRQEADGYEFSGNMTAGFEAYSYGFVMGYDRLIGQNTIAGAAFSYQKGNSNSQGDVLKTDNEFETYGAHAYMAYSPSQYLNLIGTVAYLRNTNEAEQALPFGDASKATADIDTNIVTASLRAESTFVMADGSKIVPHVGVRAIWADQGTYDTKLDGAKAFENKTDAATLVQFPVGVSVRTTKTFDSGWTVNPALDFTVIPQVGDTDQRITIEGTRGITDGISGDFTGNVVTQTTFGVQATKGDTTFGGRYGVNIGGDGRLDHQLKVEFRYAF